MIQNEKSSSVTEFRNYGKEVKVNVDPHVVKYGDLVVIKHCSTKLNLHSHPLKYHHKKSSYNQQVSCTDKNDYGDYFYILPPPGVDKADGVSIKLNDYVSLKHQSTQLFVGSKDGFSSPASRQGEVCCFLNPDEDKTSKTWIVTDIKGGFDLKRGLKFRLR